MPSKYHPPRVLLAILSTSWMPSQPCCNERKRRFSSHLGGVQRGGAPGSKGWGLCNLRLKHMVCPPPNGDSLYMATAPQGAEAPGPLFQLSFTLLKTETHSSRLKKRDVWTGTGKLRRTRAAPELGAPHRMWGFCSPLSASSVSRWFFSITSLAAV